MTIVVAPAFVRSTGENAGRQAKSLPHKGKYAIQA